MTREEKHQQPWAIQQRERGQQVQHCVAIQHAVQYESVQPVRLIKNSRISQHSPHGNNIFVKLRVEFRLYNIQYEKERMKRSDKKN